MSEAGTQIGIARLRAGAISGTAAGATSPTAAGATTPAAAGAVDLDAIRDALAEVMDPELPMLSVVDLGIVHRLEVDARDGVIRVEILPTFVGCPALELIKTSIAERLAAFGRPVEVTATFEVPWTSERISAAGRRALLAAGIAPPTAGPTGGARCHASSTSSSASRARTAAPAEPCSRTCSARPSAGRSATAPIAASRSKPSSRSDRGRSRGSNRSSSSVSSGPGRWARGSRSSRSRPATRF